MWDRTWKVSEGTNAGVSALPAAPPAADAGASATSSMSAMFVRHVLVSALETGGSGATAHRGIGRLEFCPKLRRSGGGVKYQSRAPRIRAECHNNKG
jgi:hypothetical protein